MFFRIHQWESQANGAAENAIQRIQGQIRAIKLDVGPRDRCEDWGSTPIVALVGRVRSAVWRINPTDGLTSNHRIRGKSRVAPKPRFAEQAMYRVAKNIRADKTARRWEKGVWLGSIQNSDKSMVGTPRGVIKSRSIAPLPDSQQFDTEVIDVVRGSAWKPSTRHPGSKVRMYIGEKDDDNDERDDGEELIVRSDDEDNPDEE